MKTLIDIESAPVFAIPALDVHGQASVRYGMLVEGAQGWGEFSPPAQSPPQVDLRWATAATEAGTVGWPDPVRGRIPVAVPVPAVGADSAHDIASRSGCHAADVAVAGYPDSLADDIARLEAVRDALGPAAEIRADPAGGWDVDTAAATIPLLDRAAGGLQYVEQPCGSIEQLAEVRRRVAVPIAVDESIRHALDPGALPLADAADIAVLTCAPMGGVRRALRISEAYGLPCVVSSPGETSIGLAAGLALAGALAELPFACGLGARLVSGGDLVAESRSLVPVDGHLPVAPMPPAPDPQMLARYAVTDPDTVTRWRNRLRVAAA